MNLKLTNPQQLRPGWVAMPCSTTTGYFRKGIRSRMVLFMNLHSSTYKQQSFTSEKEGEDGQVSRYLLDDSRVEAVKAAVQSDTLKEK